MCRFVKWMFISAMMFFGCNLSSANPWEYVSTHNQKCKVRLEIVDVNSVEPVFYPFSIKTSKCRGSCNPASICWSWRRLEDMPWRRLQDVFSVTIFGLPRRLKTS